MLKKSYVYDAKGQLTREDDADANRTHTYTYDGGGNILTKSTHAYTTGVLGPVLLCVEYTYAPNWGDLLFAAFVYDGDPASASLLDAMFFSHDPIGNPGMYGDMSLVWGNGRRLTGIQYAGLDVSYSYNDGGIRTRKTVDGTTTDYVLSGSSILRQTDGTTTLEFFYDTHGEVFGFTYNGTEYWYVRNGQRDIIGIVNNAGVQVVSYAYDAWGNPISTTGLYASTIGAANPFRYRGYYYDVETGFYWLQSRYYDPTLGRFINADGYADTGQGVLGANMFAYCHNNPILFVDPSGNKVVLEGGDVDGGSGITNAVLYALALVYLMASPTASETITKVTESEVTVTIKFNNEKDTYLDTEDPENIILHWDPTAALLLKNGKVLSPAFCLAHEFEHFVYLIEGNPANLNYQQYLKMEQAHVERWEIPVCEELGEYPRKKYSDAKSLIGVNSPTDWGYVVKGYWWSNIHFFINENR